MRGNFILDWGQTLFFIIYLLWAMLGLYWASLIAQLVKNLSAMRETWV